MDRTRFHSLTSIVQPRSQGSVGTGWLLGPHFNISLISSAIAGILSSLLQLDLLIYLFILARKLFLQIAW